MGIILIIKFRNVNTTNISVPYINQIQLHLKLVN